MRNFSIFLFFLFTLSCLSTVKIYLTPEEKEFLSKVRYIISKEEKEIFLKLSSSERASFIKEFWEKRDPFPETEVNEFKEEYFKRIAEAEKLFGKNGWLQDRGMVYVLLGPPTERYTYPMGSHQRDFPTEIWIYGFFPIVFVDYDWSGDYKLTPLSAYQIAEINKAQSSLIPHVKTSSISIDFDFDLENNSLEIKIPYKAISLKKRDSVFYTTLSLSIEIENERKEVVYSKNENFDIVFTLEDIKNLKSSFHLIKIEINLPKGTYSCELNLKNFSNNSFKKKEKKIIIDK
ncbi:MAG: GWxTD domain-containing protein [Candidatus Aminicenantia bacterium]